jgi:8-oxo-dGTP pyrophosphatase MutT (NUDIX family)
MVSDFDKYMNAYKIYKFNNNKFNLQCKKNKIYTINILNDSIDTTIQHAVLIVELIHNNSIIAVKDTITQLWMMPGGYIEKNETPFNGAAREFTEETSFILDRSKIILPIKYYDIKHTNKTITRIFKITTTQIFENYNINLIHNNETDALEYVTIQQIQNYISKLKHFNMRNIHTFTELIYNNFFT